MFEIFFPKLYVDSVYAVPYEKLMADGITKLIFDIDNTLAPFDQADADERLVSFMNGLKQKGFALCLVSNNSPDRVERFNEQMRLPAVARAGKPKLAGIRRAMEQINAPRHQTAIIGDQLFTDMFCGNRLNIFTILVKPISDRDEFSVRLKRGIEKIVFSFYLKKQKKL